MMIPLLASPTRGWTRAAGAKRTLVPTISLSSAAYSSSSSSSSPTTTTTTIPSQVSPKRPTYKNVASLPVAQYFPVPNSPEGYPRRLAHTEFARIGDLKGKKGNLASHFKKKSSKKVGEPLVPPMERQIMVRQTTLNVWERLKAIQARGPASSPRDETRKDERQEEEERVMLLTGPRGVGKSVSLLHLVQLARQAGWIVLYVPRCADFVTEYGALAAGTGTGVAIVRSRLRPLHFNQPLGAQRILQHLRAAHMKDLVNLPQQRQYDHNLYAPHAKARGGGFNPVLGSTLGHILVRGLRSPLHAADALYDLRMELNLVRERPVLVALDEVDFLHAPTALWHMGRPVAASELLLPSTFRFLREVPGDVDVLVDETQAREMRARIKQEEEAAAAKAAATAKGENSSVNASSASTAPEIADEPSPPPNPWSSRARVDPSHVPHYGAILAAGSRALTPPAHPTRVAPRFLELLPLRGVVRKISVEPYTNTELASALQRYTSRFYFDAEGEEGSVEAAPAVVADASSDGGRPESEGEESGREEVARETIEEKTEEAGEEGAMQRSFVVELPQPAEREAPPSLVNVTKVVKELRAKTDGLPEYVWKRYAYSV